jgi:hypothetical protein
MIHARTLGRGSCLRIVAIARPIGGSRFMRPRPQYCLPPLFYLRCICSLTKKTRRGTFGKWPTHHHCSVHVRTVGELRIGEASKQIAAMRTHFEFATNETWLVWSLFLSPICWENENERFAPVIWARSGRWRCVAMRFGCRSTYQWLLLDRSLPSWHAAPGWNGNYDRRVSQLLGSADGTF